MKFTRLVLRHLAVRNLSQQLYQLVHEIWTHALRHRIHVWVERVPSDYNIADCPSRRSYHLLRKLGALWRKPVLAELSLDAQC